MSHNERRRQLRYACKINVVIGWGSNMLSGIARDLSAEGMFVETRDPLWLRAEFTARLSLPEPIEVDCVVKRVVPGQGMGVQFKDLPEAEQEQVDILVRKLAAQ